MKHAVFLSLLLVACGPISVEPDASVDDSGVVDSGVVDAGVADAAVEDSGVEDAGEPDAGVADAGRPDSGVRDAGQGDAGVLTACPVPTGIEPPFNIRAMAANLSSGNGQDYDLGHGIRIMRGVEPDIVLIQEFSYFNSSTAEMDLMVSDNFGAEFQWRRGVGHIPNGIISRWPIVDWGEWDGRAPDRELTWAKIDLPGPYDLFVVSVHFLTSNASDRNADARIIMEQLDAGISRFDYVLVGGDFNTNSFSEIAFSTLAPRFKVTAPHPVDQSNNSGTNAARDKPYDVVLASTCLAQVQVPTRIGAAQFDAGLVVDTRVFTPISDIAPALASDSAATNMQHMGVVKDFLIQP